MTNDELMDEPPRLFGAHGAPAGLREALHAARDERPDPQRLALIAAKLPMTGAAGLGAATLKTKVILGVTAAVVGGGAGTALVMRQSPPERPPVVAPAEPVRPVIEPLVRPAPPAVTPERLPPARERTASTPRARKAPPPPVAAPPSVAPVVPIAPAPAADPSTIAEEARLLDAAKAALAGDPTQTLRLATEHQRRFAEGLLAQEREVLAIEALLKLGRTEEARERVTAFRRDFPRSAHLRRLATLLGTAP